MRCLKKILVGALITSAFFSARAGICADDAVRMGFVGGRSPAAVVRQWIPLVDYLSRAIGRPVEMVLRENYQDLIGALRSGEIDLFEGGALTHVEAIAAGGAEILVGEERRGSPTYRSVIVVRADDDAQGIEDLQSRSLALTDALSTSGYLLPRTMIAQAGVTDPGAFFRRIVLTGSHDRSLDAVMEGAVDAAAVGDFFVALLDEAQRTSLRVVAQSDPIPMGPITVRTSLSPEMKARLRQAFLSYEAEVPADLRRITEVGRFVVQPESAFDAIRRYADASKTLPILHTAIPYRRIPAIFDERVDLAKRRARVWMVGSVLVVVILLVAVGLFIRRRLAGAVGVAVGAGVLLLIVVMTAYGLALLSGSIDTYAAGKVGDLENLNLRLVAAMAGASSEGVDPIIVQAVQDDAVAWARVVQDGRIVASDRAGEVGATVLDAVRAHAYERFMPDVVTVLDPIVVGGRRRATLEVGISFAPVSNAVGRAVLMQMIALVCALAIAGFAAWFVRRRFARPLDVLSHAVESLREGDAVTVEGADGEIRPVAESIERLGREMAQKERLVELKDRVPLPSRESYDPAVTEELAGRLTGMEADHPAFGHLRHTIAIGSSPAWLRCLRDAAIRASDREPVVVLGPTGSGKTGIARSIHALSSRQDKPFGEFNCAEFASGDPLVVLGKLFGYGAGSGLHGIDAKGQRGILEEYTQGTLFFDEVELIPLQAQQLLLLPLEGRPFNPAAGRGAPRTTSARFLFATNEPLEELVHAGRMRADFLRRIQSRGMVRVPALAQRPEDIEGLAAFFLARRNRQDHRTVAMAPEVIGTLSRYGFDRYNVSELSGSIDQAFDAALFEGNDRIEGRHLPAEIRAAVGGQGLASNEGDEDQEELKELAVLRETRFNLTRAEGRLGYAVGSKTLTHHVRGMVYRSLSQVDWNREAAVARLSGEGADSASIRRLGLKVDDYIAAARRHVEADSTDKLFVKLPQKYHVHLERLLAALRSGKI